MKNSRFLTLLFLFFAVSRLDAAEGTPIGNITCRDPFILADAKTSTYYLYRSSSVKREDGSVIGGVDIMWSKDLSEWHGPKQVLTLEEGNWATGAVWAPEVHKYRGKYYMFATINTDVCWKGGTNNGVSYTYRGVQIFRASSPEGPFEALSDQPCTPMDYMALDGTLYVEDGTPYMVFCREWVQIGDGTIEMMPLKKNLSSASGVPTRLFNATASKYFQGFRNKENGSINCVTDACFLYKSKTGKLFMLWSSNGGPGKCYSVASAYSVTGRLAGPWIQSDELISNEDGGHAMVFKGFDGQLYMVYHRPNKGAPARPCIFEFIDSGDTIKIGAQIY